MSALKDQIRADLKEAMKAKEKERTGTIRMLLAAIQTAETEGSKHEVDDAEIQKIIAREIKKRRESADIYKTCLLYTSPSPRDRQKSRMPSSA